MIRWQMILAQATLVNAVRGLFERVSEIYTYHEDGGLAEVPFMQALYHKVARQTLECADSNEKPDDVVQPHDGPRGCGMQAAFGPSSWPLLR
jgi:hypothetical protein